MARRHRTHRRRITRVPREIHANPQGHDASEGRAPLHRHIQVPRVQTGQDLVNRAHNLLGARRIRHPRHHVRAVVLRHAQLKGAAHPARGAVHRVPQPIHTPERARQGVRARVRPQLGKHFDAVVVGEADESLGQLSIGAAPARQQDAGRGVSRLLTGGGIHAALVPFELLGGKEDGSVMRAAAGAPAGGRCGCRHRITQCTPAATPRIFARCAAPRTVPEARAVSV